MTVAFASLGRVQYALGLVLCAGSAVAQSTYSIARLEPQGAEHVGTAGTVSSTVQAYGVLGTYGSSQRLGVNLNGGNDMWFSDGVTTTIIGAPDPENTRTNAGRRSSFVGPVDPLSGWVVGQSQRYLGNASRGFSSWVFDGVATRRLGLTGSAYVSAQGEQNHNAFVGIVRRPAGALWVVGYSDRFDAGAGSRDGWVWDGSGTQVLGPSGPEFIGSDSYRYADIGPLDGEQEIICGASTLTTGGTGAWMWRDGVYTMLGLTSGDYVNWAGVRNSRPSLVLPNGQVLGYSTKYDTATRIVVVGEKLWLFDGSATQELALPDHASTVVSGWVKVVEPGMTLVAGPKWDGVQTYGQATTLAPRRAWVLKNGAAQTLGLSGPAYQDAQGRGYSMVTGASDAGVVAGFTDRITSGNRVGSTAWVWDGAVHQQLGLSGAMYVNNTYGTSDSRAFISAGGVVTGLNSRFEFTSQPRGTDVWRWNAGTYEVLGLNGPTHTSANGTRRAGIVRVWDSGAILGTQENYSTNTTDVGSDVWYASGTTVTQLGLQSPAYLSSSGLRRAVARASTDAGVVAGTQDDGVNTQLWYFDTTTLTTYHVKPTNATALPGSFTRLDEDGFLYGGSDLGAFVFRPDIGFVLIKDLVEGATGSTWRMLQQVKFDRSRQEFVGDGVIDEPNGGVSYASFAVTINAGCAIGTSCCDSIDFNNNAVFPEDQDVVDFLSVLAGQECGACNDIDFNNNQVFPEDQDVIDFFNVLAGGNCS